MALVGNLKDLKSYRDGCKNIFRVKNFKEIENVISIIRNKIVFHFDKDVVPDSLKNFSLDKYRFASGKGENSVNTYYGLADELSVHYLFDQFGLKTDDQRKEFYVKINSEIGELVKKFYKACEDLIIEVLLNFEWEIVNNSEQ